MSVVEREERTVEERDHVLPIPVEQRGEPGSLADRLGRRRRELEQRRKSVLTIPVTGYENDLAAQYRRLTMEEQGDLVLKHPKATGDSSDAVALGADRLLLACVDVLEVTGRDDDGKPVYRSLGSRWTRELIGELFQLGNVEGLTTRQALLKAIDSTDLLIHHAEYEQAVAELDREYEEALPGESEPSVEG